MPDRPIDPMVELRVVVDRRQVDALAALAVGLGAPGAQEAPPPGHEPVLQQPWDPEPPPEPSTCTFITWLPAERAAVGRAALERATGAQVQVLPSDPTDWSQAWRRWHHAVEVGGALRVSPPWEARPGDLVIEPGQAFGTGDHPTTRACLEWIVELAPQVRTCLDVGCGSGILALAAARLGLQAEGVDIDPVAVEEARANARRNGLDVPFSTRPPASLQGRWDIVAANLYAEVLVTLAPDLVRLAGRHLLLAGILHDRLAQVLQAIERAAGASLQVGTIREDGDWRAVHLRRR